MRHIDNLIDFAPGSTEPRAATARWRGGHSAADVARCNAMLQATVGRVACTDIIAARIIISAGIAGGLRA